MIASSGSTTFNRLQGKACRKKGFTADTKCTKDPCAHYNHVILNASAAKEVNVKTCQDLCTHTKGCTGIEYGHTMNRCEVWTEDLHPGGEAAKDFDCYVLDKPIASDKRIYVAYTFVIPKLPSGVGQDSYVLSEVRKTIIGCTTTTLRTLKAGPTADLVKQIDAQDMAVSYSAKGFTAHFTSRANVSALAYYAVLRGSNPDFIPDAKTPLTTKLNEKVFVALGKFVGNNTKISGEIKDRKFSFVVPAVSMIRTVVTTTTKQTTPGTVTTKGNATKGTGTTTTPSPTTAPTTASGTGQMSGVMSVIAIALLCLYR